MLLNGIPLLSVTLTLCDHLCSPLQLLEKLKDIRFTDNEREVYFDSHGDINTGYDVLVWKEIDGRMVITNMAEYDLERDDFIFADEEDEIEFMNLKVSRGSDMNSCHENGA